MTLEPITDLTCLLLEPSVCERETSRRGDQKVERDWHFALRRERERKET